MKNPAHSASVPTFSLSKQERWGFLLWVIALAAILTAGFIPTAHRFFNAIADFTSWRTEDREIGSALSFPLLAMFFYFSLPAQARDPHGAGTRTARDLLEISLGPILIALVYGLLYSGKPLFLRGGSAALWYGVLVPVGEEFLFRGWVFNLLKKIYGPRNFTSTNPIPVAVLGSAMTFSFWHLQNLGTDNLPHVAFQVGYTFFSGLWLGYLKWETGRLRWPILGHALLNWLS